MSQTECQPCRFYNPKNQECSEELVKWLLRGYNYLKMSENLRVKTNQLNLGDETRILTTEQERLEVEYKKKFDETKDKMEIKAEIYDAGDKFRAICQADVCNMSGCNGYQEKPLPKRFWLF